jgi:CBS-domain-containing membrane protein
MKAADIMTRDVISVPADASVVQAARLMLQRRISGLPVTDAKGNLIGIVTEGDFLRRSEIGTQRHRPRWLEFLIGPGRLATEYVRACGRKVEEIMTTDVHTVTADTPVEQVVHLMEKHRVKRIPVANVSRLVGIISRANILRAVASIAADTKPGDAGDAAIHDRLTSFLKEQIWAPMALIEITVRNGVVRLYGEITDERERQAIVVAAENTPGVKEVRDYLAWVEPTSGMVFWKNDEELDHAKAS